VSWESWMTKKIWAQWIKNKWWWYQQSVKATVRMRKIAETVKNVKTVNNNIKNVDEFKWDSDVEIDLL
jgi:beta-lactamase class D